MDKADTRMIRRRYQCPDCEWVFSYDHHPSVEADPAPRYCGRCGFDTQAEEYAPALVMPHIAGPARARVDGLHRAMEEGADFRAELAQEQFGMDSEGARAMKLGDMRDNIRPGDTADIPVDNEVSRLMAAAPPGVVGFQSGASAIGYSSAVSEGPFPNAGLRTLSAVRRQHAAAVAATGHSAPVTSSLPALETQAPGYRRRV